MKIECNEEGQEIFGDESQFSLLEEKMRNRRDKLLSLEEGSGGLMCDIKFSSDALPKFVVLPRELAEAIFISLGEDPSSIDPSSHDESSDLSDEHRLWLTAFMKLELGICIDNIDGED